MTLFSLFWICWIIKITPSILKIDYGTKSFRNQFLASRKKVHSIDDWMENLLGISMVDPMSFCAGLVLVLCDENTLTIQTFFCLSTIHLLSYLRLYSQCFSHEFQLKNFSGKTWDGHKFTCGDVLKQSYWCNCL